MRILRGENGAALVTALMLTMLSLVIAMTLLYAVTTGTRISASQKRYRNALAAAQGGVDLVTQEIIPRLLRNDAPLTSTSLQADFAQISLKLPAYGCLQQKLTASSQSWSACSAKQVNPDPADAPDLSFTLGGALPGEPGYSVTMKIVETVPGNSDSEFVDYLDQGNSVTGRDESIHPQHKPGLFNISVQGVGGSPREKARLSLLYSY
jgi:hypothetical protein